MNGLEMLNEKIKTFNKKNDDYLNGLTDKYYEQIFEILLEYASKGITSVNIEIVDNNQYKDPIFERHKDNVDVSYEIKIASKIDNSYDKIIKKLKQKFHLNKISMKFKSNIKYFHVYGSVGRGFGTEYRMQKGIYNFGKEPNCNII